MEVGDCRRSAQARRVINRQNEVSRERAKDSRVARVHRTQETHNGCVCRRAGGYDEASDEARDKLSDRHRAELTVGDRGEIGNLLENSVNLIGCNNYGGKFETEGKFFWAMYLYDDGPGWFGRSVYGV